MNKMYWALLAAIVALTAITIGLQACGSSTPAAATPNVTFLGAGR